MAEKLRRLSADYIRTKQEWLQDCRNDGTISDSQGGCHLWNGATSDRSERYGKVMLCEGGVRFSIGVHVLCFFLATSIAPSKGDDVSHLCHNTLCVNPAHLTLEPHKMNMERRRCKREQVCCGHEPRPSCFFLW